MDYCQSIDTIFLEKTEISGKKAYTFLIVDGISVNPIIANAIATSTPLGKSIVKEIGLEAENTIVSYYQKKVKFEEDRMMIVFDLDEFPYIKTYVDRRDPNEMYAGENDKFSNDVKQTYNTYDQKTQIPVILVNLDINFTGLKVIPLLTPDESK